MNTGEFSNSWGEEDMNNPVIGSTVRNGMADADKANWKLIEYTCLNSKAFEFYNMMKIVTNRPVTDDIRQEVQSDLQLGYLDI